MITLSIIIFCILVILFAVLAIAGGTLLVFIDPIVAVLLIVLFVKIIQKIRNKE